MTFYTMWLEPAINYNPMSGGASFLLRIDRKSEYKDGHNKTIDFEGADISEGNRLFFFFDREFQAYK